MTAWSLYRELPDDECTEDYGFILMQNLQSIRVHFHILFSKNINPVTGALDFVTAWSRMIFILVSIHQILLLMRVLERETGQTGKTTDAYDLGAPVAALDSTKNSKKKKDEEEEEEEKIFGSEQKELN